MILDGAGTCPLIKIGDTVKGREVIDIICDRDTVARCNAYKTLAILRLEALGVRWYVINPSEAVNCNECPVLAKDPDHFSKTKPHQELIIATGKPRSSLVTRTKMPEDIEPVPLAHKHRDRFELIDISKEETSDAKSRSDTNK